LEVAEMSLRPVRRTLHGRQSQHLSGSRGANNRIILDFHDLRDNLPRAPHPSQPPACHSEFLRKAADREGAVGGPRESNERGHDPESTNKRPIYHLTNKPDPILTAEIEKNWELPARKPPPSGVGRFQNNKCTQLTAHDRVFYRPGKKTKTFAGEFLKNAPATP